MWLLSWHATESIGRWLLDKVRLGEVARKVIERFDVRTPSADPLANQLSGGNLQKYVVGREIERKPRLMIVDQPSWGVDARARHPYPPDLARSCRWRCRCAGDLAGS